MRVVVLESLMSPLFVLMIWNKKTSIEGATAVADWEDSAWSLGDRRRVFSTRNYSKELVYYFLNPPLCLLSYNFHELFFSNALWYLKSSYEYLTYVKSGWSGKSLLWGIPWLEAGEGGVWVIKIREPITIPKSYKIMYINSSLICCELCWVLQNYKVLQRKKMLFYLLWFCFGVRGAVCTDPVGWLRSTAIIMIAFLERLLLADVQGRSQDFYEWGSKLVPTKTGGLKSLYYGMEGTHIHLPR